MYIGTIIFILGVKKHLLFTIMSKKLFKFDVLLIIIASLATSQQHIFGKTSLYRNRKFVSDLWPIIISDGVFSFSVTVWSAELFLKNWLDTEEDPILIYLHKPTILLQDSFFFILLYIGNNAKNTLKNSLLVFFPLTFIPIGWIKFFYFQYK